MGDGAWLVVEYLKERHGMWHAWNLATGKELSLTEPFNRVTFNADGRFALGGWSAEGGRPLSAPTVVRDLRTGQPVGPAEFHRVLVQKPCPGPDELEFAGMELLCPVIGKIIDQQILPRHHLLKIETDLSGANAPGPGMAGQVHHFSGVKQRLRGHAAAQDAQPADLVATFDDDGFQTRGGGGSGRRVTTTATTQDRYVKIKPVHAGRMEAISNLTTRFNSLTIER